MTDYRPKCCLGGATQCQLCMHHENLILPAVVSALRAGSAAGMAFADTFTNMQFTREFTREAHASICNKKRWWAASRLVQSKTMPVSNMHACIPTLTIMNSHEYPCIHKLTEIHAHQPTNLRQPTNQHSYLLVHPSIHPCMQERSFRLASN